MPSHAHVHKISINNALGKIPSLASAKTMPRSRGCSKSCGRQGCQPTGAALVSSWTLGPRYAVANAPLHPVNLPGPRTPQAGFPDRCPRFQCCGLA
jgi:hypothetical protein